MKTLTTTLAIFALLFSSTAFSLDLNEDIMPPLVPQKPRFENNTDLNNITPPLIPQKPRFENIFNL